MIHAKLVQPRYFPNNSTRQPGQIDRAQDIGGDLTLGQDKLYEIGREEKVGVKKNTPTLAYPLTQYEYGSMDFWYALANLANPVTGASHFIELDDLQTTMTEITAYLTDDDNTFKGSIWFPKLRVAGFSLNIGDPNAAVQRKFNLVGEDFKILPGKYFAYADGTVGVLPTGVSYTMHFGATGEAPEPIAYSATEYIFKVLRIRAGVCTELVETIDWTYSNSTKLLTVLGCSTSDLIKVYYPAATAYTTLWTDNDNDPDALFAEDCEIYMKVGTSERVYRLQSIGIDVTFTRTDYKEIGNKEVVQTGVKDKNVVVKLDRYNEGFSLETIMDSDTTYPYIDPRDFTDAIKVQVKIYKWVAGVRTFAMGYLITKLSPTALGTSTAIQDYQKVTNTLESDNILISDQESEIAI